MRWIAWATAASRDLLSTEALAESAQKNSMLLSVFDDYGNESMIEAEEYRRAIVKKSRCSARCS